MIARQVCDDAAPHVSVGDDSVQKHDRGAGAGDAVLDRAFWNMKDVALTEYG
ncbi:hypothetical protein ISF6_3912 [Piscinibacter sakaiensis]|uniref:Uncharacterized protein n=1 Tax=Piscinibacter sakaiensis TaxID=1547922 RepID=A0A0K8NUT4_PISS1|nr:hypothetical protein ISF6_3912 [Piscinibacter sakaiensis]